MRSVIPRIVLLAATTLVLAACYESPEITRHEPGVYKGESDALVGKLGSDSELHEQLNRRFDGQRDR
ncbi:MAG TPA: hypothetical protein VJ908_07510 [Wenzhouxiangellaceae bacterium]|nr:hypothetical protein [Wenzhouxiangellaceae bacterium]